jgi:LemA protein
MVGLGIILGIVVIVALIVISVYNKLVKYKYLVQEAWSGIDVFHKKRHDMVPNLVNIVKGYATHEKEALENIIRCRQMAVSVSGKADQVVVAENNLGMALNALRPMVENYPELKANVNFLNLQNQLADLEEEIERARRYYNGTARQLNTYMENFPQNLIAGMFNFEKAVFFTLDSSAEKAVPTVNF